MQKRIIFAAAGLGIGLGTFTILLNLQSNKTLDISAPVGVWSWEAPGSLSASQLNEQATKLKNIGVEQVFIDITSYVDAMELPADQDPQKAISDFTNNLKGATRSYNAAGIKPFALAGSSKWGSPDLQYLPVAIVDYVKNYNELASPEEKLHGIQFDIEPYSEPGFYEDVQNNLKNYLSVTKVITERFATNFSQDTNLGFAVPFWFDGENPDIPQITINNTTSYPAFHLIDQLQSVPNGYIAVMAYRNQTGGEDGSIIHTQNEIDYALKTQTVKVYIGQETTNVQPEKITFYSLGVDALKSAMKELDNTFRHNRSYGGIIIHDTKGLQELKAN